MIDSFLLTLIGIVSIVFIVIVAAWFYSKWKGMFEWWDRKHGKKPLNRGT